MGEILCRQPVIRRNIKHSLKRVLSICIVLTLLFILVHLPVLYTKIGKSMYPVQTIKNTRQETKGSISYMKQVKQPITESISDMKQVNNSIKDTVYDMNQVNYSSKPKRILYWFPRPRWHYMILSKYKAPVFKSLGCKIDNCIYTENMELADQSDAIVFYFTPDGKTPDKPNKLPHQRWIWFTSESACYSFEKGGKWAGMFNWTMTFRLDSSIYSPFGFIRKRATPIKKNYTEITLKKSKLVAWMVSHCETFSKREQYVKELRKYIPVDVYGKCGQFKCQKQKDEYCLSEISRDYKFYLAFENSISTDYITEKYFKMAERDIVVVTRGPANYSRIGIKPNWHINTNNFKSPKDLADYLIYLDRNITEYVSYLEWKDQYESPPKINMWCDLCAKLNDPNEPVTWYKPGELYDWFNKGDCLEPKDLPSTHRK